jgi:hypothetical protein
VAYQFQLKPGGPPRGESWIEGPVAGVIYRPDPALLIGSGEKWYEAILSGLKQSDAVIVLLSQHSQERRWINFEAGFAMSQGEGVRAL